MSVDSRTRDRAIPTNRCECRPANVTHRNCTWDCFPTTFPSLLRQQRSLGGRSLRDISLSHRIKSQPCVCPEPRLSLISQRQGTYVNTTQTSITYATATVNAVQDYSPSQQPLSKVNGVDEKNKVLSFTVAPLPENGHYFQNSIGPPLILARHVHIRDKTLVMPRRNGSDLILRAFLGQGHSLLILR